MNARRAGAVVHPGGDRAGGAGVALYAKTLLRVTTTMAKLQLILGMGVGAALVLCSCGEAEDPPSRLNRTIGGVKEGAPLGRAAVDPGILQDPSTYQPAKLTGVQGGSGFGDDFGDASGAADETTQVNRVVAQLATNVKEGRVELILGSFRPDDVAVLTGDEAAMTVLFNTFDTIDPMERSLVDALDINRAEQMLAIVRGLAGAEPTWELLGPGHVSVQPNLASLLFGPERKTPTLALGLSDDGWKYELDSPLTADDVSGILDYHEKLQDALDEVTSWLDAGEGVTEERVREVLTKAVAGEPLGLTGDGSETDDTEGEESTDDQPERHHGGMLRPS